MTKIAASQKKKNKAYGGYAEKYFVTRHNNSAVTQIPLI